jgi:hypothetical protein
MGLAPKWHFVPRLPLPKFSKLKLLRLWGPITLCPDFWLRWSLKQSCSPCWELSNGMLHATCMQGNWGDSWLLVVESQIVNLILGPSFGHNLCLKCPNGSCKPILDIYVPRVFQWYTKRLDLMGFDSWNHSLKFLESIRTPKWKFTWECEGSFPHTFLHSWEHEMWLLSFPLDPHPCKPLPWSWAWVRVTTNSVKYFARI